MFQYFFTRLKRKIRASLTRAYHQGRFEFGADRLARALAAVLVLSASFTAVPRGEAAASRLAGERSPAAEGEGSVAGAKGEAGVSPALPEWPRRKEDAPELGELSAEAALVVDSKTGKVLYEKNGNLRQPPASLTKIMTAVVALEKYPLGKEFVVSEACLLGLKGKAHMDLRAGERITLKNLLYGLLMHSAADAACVLARDPETAFDDSRAGEAEFIAAMNRKAAELGLENTHFENNVGLDGEGHYSTARDLMEVIQEAMRSKIFQVVVATRDINVHDAGEPPARWHRLKNTNDLLFELPEVTGIKTGTTEGAGECLAASWLEGEREIYAVLLGSAEDQRFGEMKRIIEWVRNSYEVRE